MGYPFWEAGVGYGALMGGIATLHVFISHFAVGGGLYLVWAETFARRRGETEALDYLWRLSRFFVLLSLVLGALTGVGIWFIIGLIGPAATEVLIHHFVWAWAIEWTFFAMEICAAILYFYGWKNMSARNHLIIGWLYFINAWLSLLAINGIITFMLTPGKWIETGQFWDGILNPTFWPSLVMRTGIAFLMAGLYALWVITRFQASPGFKARMVRYNTLWGLAGLGLALAAFTWYRAAIPAETMERAVELMRIPWVAVDMLYLVSGVIAVLLLAGLVLPRAMIRMVAGPLLILGVVWFGSFEWWRESVRKPYVIHGYMYGNGVTVEQTERFKEEGLLANMPFRTGNDGADLFRRACASCHTFENYNALLPKIAGLDQAFLAGLIRGAHVIRGNMPPFPGTEEESEVLAEFIHARTDARPFTEVHAGQGVELGRKVFEMRCGMCHSLGGGYQDLAETITSYEKDEYEELLEEIGDLSEEMPAFSGSDVEKGALIEYFEAFKKEVAADESS